MNKYLKKCREYGLDTKKLSKLYKYANVAAFRNSSKYKTVLSASAELICIIEHEMIKRLKIN